MAACESDHRSKTQRNHELVVIDACMFSGKSGRIIWEAERLERAGVPFQTFKHPLDERYAGVATINSHNNQSIPCEAYASPFEIYAHVRPDTAVVLIDEAQFYVEEAHEFVLMVEKLAEEGRIVIVAGLGLDFRGEGFGPMPELLAHATKVEKLFAVCACCGSMHADRTQRMVDGRPANYSDPVIMVGAKESYEARCRDCHEVPGAPSFEKMFTDFLNAGQGEGQVLVAEIVS